MVGWFWLGTWIGLILLALWSFRVVPCRRCVGSRGTGCAVCHDRRELTAIDQWVAEHSP
jgi:hypothetical protein